MKRVVRLNERDLTKLIKRVIVENAPTNNMCVAEKADSGRPNCTKVGVKSGKLIVTGDERGGGMAFLMYKDKDNCPKLCMVANETMVELS